MRNMYIGIELRDAVSGTISLVYGGARKDIFLVGRPSEWGVFMYKCISDAGNEIVEGIVVDSKRGSFTASRVVALFALGFQYLRGVKVVEGAVPAGIDFASFFVKAPRHYAGAVYSAEPRINISL